jgi:hypothetical protein
MPPEVTQAKMQRVQETYSRHGGGRNGRQVASGMFCLRGESFWLLDDGRADVRNAGMALRIACSFQWRVKHSAPSATVPWWGTSTVCILCILAKHRSSSHYIVTTSGVITFVTVYLVYGSSSIHRPGSTLFSGPPSCLPAGQGGLSPSPVQSALHPGNSSSQLWAPTSSSTIWPWKRQLEAV